MLNFNFPLFMLMLQIQTEYTHWISAEVFEDWAKNFMKSNPIVKCLSDKHILIWLIWGTVIYSTVASVLPDKIG